MDGSEDLVSFKSAHESESDEDFVDSIELTSSSPDPGEDTQLCNSASKSSQLSRPSTPYQLLPKRTTPKRPAPQPPSPKRPLPPLPTQKEGSLPTAQEKDSLSITQDKELIPFTKEEESLPPAQEIDSVPQTKLINSTLSNTMTTFAQQFRNAERTASKDQISPEDILKKFASHPVLIKTTETHESESSPTSFSNLQIRLIDDESDLEIEKSSGTPTANINCASLFPSCDAPSSTTLALQSSLPPNFTPSGMHSNVSNVGANAKFQPATTYTTVSPQGAPMPFCTYPFQNVAPFNNVSPIYENVIPHQFAGNPNFSYLSPVASMTNPYISAMSHPLGFPQPAAPHQSNSLALVPSPPPAMPAASTPAIMAPGESPPGGQGFSNSPPRGALALSHSASDSAVAKRTKSAFLTSPSTYPELTRLSEGEEEEDDSRSDRAISSSQSWDYVKRDSRRVKRSDSVVTVAHLYEDIIVSSRYKVKVTLTNLAVVVILAAIFVPNSAAILFNAFRLVFGTLFPAYYSYKAVRTKNIQEYVKWMMYWIVFAFFTCLETITDVLLSFWFPFYYELKILVVLWLLSPATKGSSILYRKFVHPWLTKREEEIDECIAKAKQQGYSTVVQLGTKGVNYATSVIMQTAIKGGGGIVNQLKRSYSASEIGEDAADMNRNVKALPSKDICEDDDRSVSSGSYESEPRHRAESESSYRPRGHSTGRTARASKARSADVSDVYFHDVQDSVPQRRSPRTHEPSNSISGTVPHQPVTRRSRTGDVSSYATLPRTASKRAAAKKRQM